MMSDPYQVLGVSRDASDREIKKAYRTMSRKYHPDSYSEDSEKQWAEDKFRQVQEAYNQIVDERSGKSSQSYGGYGGQSSQNYSEEDQHLMAAMNYIRARRYNEAINVLNSIPNRSARWYYFSSYANLGLGNNVVAMDYAKRAVEMEPGNPEFVQYYQQLQRGGTASPFGGSPFGGSPFGGGYGGYGGYGGPGMGSCGTGNLCCDLWCADTMCECMGGDLCGCM
ncbi:MAG: J domain-containing protein [Lachnospiraceae bacterium]|nr:J domain-containing protein [Lachnospiraceae bacterium]